MARNQSRNHQDNEYEEKVITISRVSKKTKGGDQMSFTALMVVGDRRGKVGVGLGKAKDVVSAIKKGIKHAKRKMITVPIDGTTIPFTIQAEHGAGKVLLKPASKGSGVIAGGPVRSVVEAAGIKDVSAKILGSDNQASSVHATFQALKNIKRIIKVRGISVKQEDDNQDEVVEASAKPSKSKLAKKKEPKKKEPSKKSQKETNTSNKKTTKTVKKSTKKAEEKTEKKTEKKIEKKSAAKKDSKDSSSKKKDQKAKAKKDDQKEKKEEPNKEDKKKKEKK